MTLAEGKAELTAHLAADLDNKAGDTPSGAELTAQINFGLRTVGRRLFIVKPVTVAAVAASPVQLDTQTPNAVVDVFRASWDGEPLLDYQDKAGLVTHAELEALAGFDWQSLAAGTPTRAMQLAHRLYLVPAPSAAADLTLMAQILPVKMVDTTDDAVQFDLPVWTHEAVIYVAAAYAANPQVSEDEGFARLKRYSEEAATLIMSEGQANAAMWGRSLAAVHEEESGQDEPEAGR